MLRAVDLQQILLQTTSVEKIQQTQQQQSELQQRYVAMHENEEKKILKEKVKESEDPDKVRMQREEERERKRKRARDQQRAAGVSRPHTPQEEEPPEENQGGRINIRV